MSVQRSLALGALALAASMQAGYAGPCTQEIDRMQARIDAMSKAVAAAGPTARENTAAAIHDQPTPDSTVEEGLSRTRAEQVLGAMAWARAADGVGERSDCQRALEEVQRAIEQIETH
jgi:hypothetical protein